MEFSYVTRKNRDEDGKETEIHFLTEARSGRVFGYIDTPIGQQLCYVARPYHGSDRWYLRIDEAKAHLEAVAIEEWMDELKAIEKLGRLQAHPRKVFKKHVRKNA